MNNPRFLHSPMMPNLLKTGSGTKPRPISTTGLVDFSAETTSPLTPSEMSCTWIPEMFK